MKHELQTCVTCNVDMILAEFDESGECFDCQILR